MTERLQLSLDMAEADALAWVLNMALDADLPEGPEPDPVLLRLVRHNLRMARVTAAGELPDDV